MVHSPIGGHRGILENDLGSILEGAVTVYEPVEIHVVSFRIVVHASFSCCVAEMVKFSREKAGTVT